ncbi:hypothetical protein V3F56_04615 [Moorellaceae bacterium AZ2]
MSPAAYLAYFNLVEQAVKAEVPARLKHISVRRRFGRPPSGPGSPAGQERRAGEAGFPLRLGNAGQDGRP